MKILLDSSIPPELAGDLKADVRPEWHSRPKAELLRAAEAAGYTHLLTTDHEPLATSLAVVALDTANPKILSPKAPIIRYALRETPSGAWRRYSLLQLDPHWHLPEWRARYGE